MNCFHFITRQISDLNGESILNEISLSQLKKNTEILVIDDDVFAYLDALRKNEFQIEHRTDIQSLKDVAEYDMVLCDIRGVGKFLGSEYGGAYLVKQLKEKYPNKIIVSYTADDYNPKFEEFLKYADSIVPKGTTLEDWDALLTKLIKELANPVKQWEKTRKALLEANVATITVAKYEAQYVKAVKDGNFESLKKLYANKNDIGAEIMKALLNSVVPRLIKKVKG